MPDAPTPQLCFSLLHRLYLLCEKEQGVAVVFWREEDKKKLSLCQAQSAVAWLQREDLLAFSSKVGMVCLTELGISTVLSALARPEQATQTFPALLSFYVSDSGSAVGLSATTLNVWLDQLRCCSSVLDYSVSCREWGLDFELKHLEECLTRSSVDPASLLFGLVELKESL